MSQFSSAVSRLECGRISAAFRNAPELRIYAHQLCTDSVVSRTLGLLAWRTVNTDTP